MKFAEFQAGQVLTYGPARVSEEEIVAFARQYDPQWFHLDPARASKSRWEGLIASGWQTCGLAMRLVAEGALQGSESFGSPGLEYLKWPAPVRPGDDLTLEVQVLETRRSERKPTLGLVHWRWVMRNPRAECVLDLAATSMFDLGVGPAGIEPATKRL